MPRLAFTTFGILREPETHPDSQGFVDRTPDTYDAAEHSDGFIDRSRRDSVTNRHSWGDGVCPQFAEGLSEDRIAQTVSLWKDLESVFAFVYVSRSHGQALKLRKDWFIDAEYPGYAAWWVADDDIPTFAEATTRLEALHRNGSSPFAFNFKQPFSPAGIPIKVEQARVGEKAELNRQLHGDN